MIRFLWVFYPKGPKAYFQVLALGLGNSSVEVVALNSYAASGPDSFQFNWLKKDLEVGRGSLLLEQFRA